MGTWALSQSGDHLEHTLFAMASNFGGGHVHFMAGCKGEKADVLYADCSIAI